MEKSALIVGAGAGLSSSLAFQCKIRECTLLLQQETLEN